MDREKLHQNFFIELDYIIKKMEMNIKELKILENKIYLELTKEEIVDYFNYFYKKMKEWLNYYKINNYQLIINEYKKVESVVSELELCLVDYNDIFQIKGISYSLFKIGEILNEIRKESD